MGTHTVAEARDRLPELIERALKGEGVVITQDGDPVVELKPIQKSLRTLTQADIDWLDKHRVPREHGGVDAVTLIRNMRDESDP
jgi:prevent-host-death family protein